MSDMPERIKAWLWNGKTNAGGWHVNGQGTVETYIRRDAPELVALVEALRAFRAFDELPTQAKRPDVFEFRVRQPLLRALAAYEALK
jgi:hypothetical protein